MADEAPDVDTIFCAAIEVAAAEERAAYIAQACGENQELRGQVEKLVGAHFRAGGFLEGPLVSPYSTIDAPVREHSGTVIGPYKLLQQIGEGGMGTVFMAEQTHPVQRKVALKIIKPGTDSTQVIARFEAERQALAIMDHPNIAKVFDAGETTDGRPYFVMELVKGQAITRYCDDQRLTPRQRLELFRPVCLAIQHAHQKGIIHRDIKPSNVLVAPYDGKPVVKVIDFGLAKAAGQRLTERTLFTEFGAVLGTLEYMSPEQAELNNQDVDTRSDIYSLGVLLYELLTGTTPLGRARLKQVAFMEVLRMIREDEPPKPSMRLSELGRSGPAQPVSSLASISAQRQTEPAKLTKLMRGELDWIVMKALAKERDRRYETASVLAADVERFLNDEPVSAGPPTARYRLRKLMQKHRTAMIVTGLGTLLLLAATVVSSTFAIWADWERNEAIAARKDEETALQEAVKQRNAATTYALRWMLDQAAREGDDAPENLLWLARALAVVPKEQPELESFIRHALTLRAQNSTGESAFRAPPISIPHVVLAVGPGGHQLLVAGTEDDSDSGGGLWDIAQQRLQPLQPPRKDQKTTIVDGAFSPKGTFLFAWVQGYESYLWECASGRCLGMVADGHFDPIKSFFTPDEKLLVAVRVVLNEKPAVVPFVAVLRPENLERHSTARPPGGVTAAQLDGDRRAFWTYGGDFTVRRWDLDKGTQLGEPWVFQEGTTAVFSLDGQHLLTAGPDREVRAFELKSRQPLGPAMQRSFPQVSWLAIAPGGKGVAITTDPDANALRGGWSVDLHVDCYDFPARRKSHVRVPNLPTGAAAYGIDYSPDNRHLIGYTTSNMTRALPIAASGGGGMTGNPPGSPFLLDTATARLVGSSAKEGPAVWMPDGRSYWNSTDRYYLTTFPGDAKAARLWAEVFTFHELADTDTVRVLDESAWEGRRRALQEWAAGEQLPQNLVATIRDRTRWLLWRINALAGAEHPDKTLPLYDRLIGLNPSPGNLIARGQALQQARRYAEAVADMSEALQKDATLVHLHYDRGHAYAGLERWADALRDLESFHVRRSKERLTQNLVSDGQLDELYDVALLQWVTGASDGWRASCGEARALIKRLPKLGPKQVHQVLWICSLFPDGPDNPAELEILVQQKLRTKDTAHYTGVEIHMYRTGKFQQIVDRLPADKLTTNDMAPSLHIRALALLKLGRKDEARKSLESARAHKASLEKNAGRSWQNEILWRVLQREWDALKP